MLSVQRLSSRLLSTTCLGLMIVSHAGFVGADDEPKIVNPGAVGEASRTISAAEAVAIAVNSYTPDDVYFMQNMIPHHNQAVQMVALVEERTNNPALVDIARRIKASQADEIDFMMKWLEDRDETTPDPRAHEDMDMSKSMSGMATPEDMAKLAASNGVDFDRLFLSLMINHHKGAITMVKDLYGKNGSAYDPVLYEFTTDVDNDQNAEITRMNAVYLDLSGDPRANLKAGYRDAGEAAWNLELVQNLPKPAGFFDPENPLEMRPVIGEEDGKPKRGKRRALLDFSITDMAFKDDKLVVGSYHGFMTYQLSNAGVPDLLGSVVCPGGQGDVSIVGDLLIMSVEQTRGRKDCGLQGVSEDISDERFRGIRIFDVSDYSQPVQVGQVQTCRGSHTHSVVSGPGEDGKIIVYNSGTSSVRDNEELEGCIGNVAGDDRTALFRIDVIEIPVADPSKSRIVDSPAVFADEETGQLAGLWRGGDHGDDTQTTRQTNQCHDITVFPEAKLAAGACSGNGIIFDISDPLKPTRIDAVTDPGFSYWHSATFNNDGTKVLFTDEWGGGGRPRCMANDPMTWGANAFYDIEDKKLVFKGNFKMPAPQTEFENCVAHNGSIIPVPGRDIFVQSWYQGGISVMDFTDSSDVHEIGFFDRGPLNDEVLVGGGYWSSYWYGGKIYATAQVRGLDVMALKPSEHLSENEIKAAELANQGKAFNPQQQYQVTWPAVPVVAKAYVDQLNRAEALSSDLSTRLMKTLDDAEAAMASGSSGTDLAAGLSSLSDEVAGLEGTASVMTRAAKLSDTLSAVAETLGG